MKIGLKIDALYSLRASRLELQKKIDLLKAEESTMRAEILNELESAGLAKASGDNATCGVTTTLQPLVEDWNLVFNYVKENDRFDLLQKRLSAPAWRELVLDDDILVPGTQKNMVQDLSLTKSHR